MIRGPPGSKRTAPPFPYPQPSRFPWRRRRAMNNGNRLDLLQLLPALYRSLDITAGSPLQALMAVMQRQYDAIDANIEQLYDDWFIETCQDRSEEHTSELQSLMRNSYAVFCLKKKKSHATNTI